MISKARSFIAVLASIIAVPAGAESFQPVTDKDRFLQTISGQELTRMGISLVVKPSGQIEGAAFGQKVKGAWTWSDGYFCRDLFWGDKDLGYNCQEVQVNGSTLKFTSDRGTGRSAELKLR